MVQYLQINKHNTPHKQNKGQKPHDNIIDVGKAFDKIQYPFMIKNTQQSGTRGEHNST